MTRSAAPNCPRSLKAFRRNARDVGDLVGGVDLVVRLEPRPSLSADEFLEDRLHVLLVSGGNSLGRSRSRCA
jgi:hypothetical protein